MSGVDIIGGDIVAIDDVMAIMDHAFDPVFGEAWTATQCAGLLPMPGVWLRIAYSNGKAVGFSMARSLLDEAELLLLAVDPDSQRQGIGKLLVDDFMAEAARREANRVHLEVRDGNPAVILYRRAGFDEVGRRPSYYKGSDGQSRDAITLSRSVNI